MPNKVCTLAEALFAWADLEGNDEPVDRYALPTLKTVVALQVPAPGKLAGAIPQYTLNGRVVARYFPFYVARCIPALLQAYDFTGVERWLDAAVAAMGSIARQVDQDGRLPQVLYTHGVNRYPQWIAPLGDVLRAGDLLASYGCHFELQALRETLLSGRLCTGGVATAHGFGAQIHQRKVLDALPDFRDLVAVAGWSDKAFRYFAGQLPPQAELPPPNLEPFEQACIVRGRPAIWRETPRSMTLETKTGRNLYKWQKGEPWATVLETELVWK